MLTKLIAATRLCIYTSWYTNTVQMKLQHPAGWSVREEGSSQQGVCFSSNDRFGSIPVVHVLSACRREWLVLLRVVGLLPERVVDDPARLRSNLRKFLDLDFDILLVGDGESILRNAKARLKELVETFTD